MHRIFHIFKNIFIKKMPPNSGSLKVQHFTLILRQKITSVRSLQKIVILAGKNLLILQTNEFFKVFFKVIFFLKILQNFYNFSMFSQNLSN